MEIFFIKKEEFLNKNGIDFIEPFVDKDFKSGKRRVEYGLGRFILNFALKNFYKIKDFEIEIKDEKPVLKNGEIHFSISHSKNLVMAVFGAKNAGLDVEFIKDRNFEAFSNYFGHEFQNKEDFYSFWTQKEAKFKLKEEPEELLTFKFLNDYMVSIASAVKILPLNLYEIGEDLCLRKSEF